MTKNDERWLGGIMEWFAIYGQLVDFKSNDDYERVFFRWKIYPAKQLGLFMVTIWTIFVYGPYLLLIDISEL